MEHITNVLNEIQKVIIGKEEVVKKVLMAIFADGHILLDDVPGVGKTTLAVALGKALGLEYHRIQFTPDVLPSDIVGFSVYDKENAEFIYMPGIVNHTNLLLADEINRTSSRTQSALLEAMEEGQVTVDGKVHPLPSPFIVIATENNVGTAGTQRLPHAQLDRFLVKLTVGYPDHQSQMDIIKGRQVKHPLDVVQTVLDSDKIADIQRAVLAVTMKDEIVKYITDLTEATRDNPYISLGISPRGAVAVSHMAKACALMNGRDYVVNEDVQYVFCDVCAHRILPSQKARAEKLTNEDILKTVLDDTKPAFGI